MLATIILVLAAVMFSCRICVWDTDLNKTSFWFAVHVLLLSCFLTLVGIVPLLLVGIPYRYIDAGKTITQTSSEYNIISVADKDITSGRFVLGTGTIGTRQYYVTFIETNRGYKQKLFDIDDTYIKESNATPIVTHYYNKYDDGIWWRMIWIVSCFQPSRDWYTHSILTVPPNTIMRKFHIGG